MCSVSGCPLARKLRAERNGLQRQSFPVSMAALPPVAPPVDDDDVDGDDGDDEDEEIAVDQPSGDECCEPRDVRAMDDSAAARESISSPESSLTLPISATE